MTPDYYAEYAMLDAQAREIAGKMEILKALIVAEMDAKSLKSQEHALGKFTVSKLKSWTYPSPVVEMAEKVNELVASMKDEVKAAEALAQSTGEATFTEKESLRFTPVTI